MILGPITLVDCLAFVCLFLVNIVFYPSQCIAVLLYAIKASPFLGKWPYLLRRLLVPRDGVSQNTKNHEMSLGCHGALLTPLQSILTI